MNSVEPAPGLAMAYVLFRDPVAPVRCAIRLSQALRSYPHLRLRRGLHAGPVYRGVGYRRVAQRVTQDFGLEHLEAQAPRDEGIFGDHLRRILVLPARAPRLGEIVTGVLRGQPCPTAESFYRLRSAGIMSGESVAEVRPRCLLCQLYQSRHVL